MPVRGARGCHAPRRTRALPSARPHPPTHTRRSKQAQARPGAADLTRAAHGGTTAFSCPFMAHGVSHTRCRHWLWRQRVQLGHSGGTPAMPVGQTWPRCSPRRGGRKRALANHALFSVGAADPPRTTRGAAGAAAVDTTAALAGPRRCRPDDSERGPCWGAPRLAIGRVRAPLRAGVGVWTRPTPVCRASARPGVPARTLRGAAAATGTPPVDVGCVGCSGGGCAGAAA